MSLAHLEKYFNMYSGIHGICIGVSVSRTFRLSACFRFASNDFLEVADAFDGRSAPLICILQRASRRCGSSPLPLSAATVAFQFVERTEDAAPASSFLMGLGIKPIGGSSRRDNVIEKEEKWTVGNHQCDHCIVSAGAKRSWQCGVS